jgi:hypothetical protein
MFTPTDVVLLNAIESHELWMYFTARCTLDLEEVLEVLRSRSEISDVLQVSFDL